MAEQIGTNFYLNVATVDLSDHIEDLKISEPDELQEYVTAGTAPIYKKRLGGVRDFSVTVTLADDLAASEVDATLYPLIGTAFTVIAAINGSTPSATNKVWTFTARFAEYSVGSTVGQRLQKQITFVNASGSPVADTTP
jgi:hypothetical protein